MPEDGAHTAKERLITEAARVGAGLRDRRWTIALAESCTGGMLAAALTAEPGASAYVLGGVIAYSDDVKVSVLGVDERLVQNHGAVSKEVALAMAVGVMTLLRSDIGVGITGVAGPGGVPGTPTGVMWVAAVAPGIGEPADWVRRVDGRGDRESNRVEATRAALALVHGWLR